MEEFALLETLRLRHKQRMEMIQKCRDIITVARNTDGGLENREDEESIGRIAAAETRKFAERTRKIAAEPRNIDQKTAKIAAEYGKIEEKREKMVADNREIEAQTVEIEAQTAETVKLHSEMTGSGHLVLELPKNGIFPQSRDAEVQKKKRSVKKSVRCWFQMVASWVVCGGRCGRAN